MRVSTIQRVNERCTRHSIINMPRPKDSLYFQILRPSRALYASHRVRKPTSHVLQFSDKPAFENRAAMMYTVGRMIDSPLRRAHGNTLA